MYPTCTSMRAASACECPGVTGTPPGRHGVLQGPLRCRGGEGPWESQAAFKCNYCHFLTVKPPQTDQSLVFKTNTLKPIRQLTGATHSCRVLGLRGEAGVGAGAAPTQSRDSPRPPACPGAGGLQVCPGNPLLSVQEVLYRSLFSVGP